MNKYFKSFGLYAIVFLIILAAVAYTGPGIMDQNKQTAATEAYVYSDLLQELEANNVTSVEVARSTEVSDYGTAVATLKDGKVITVNVPSMSTLQAELHEKSVENGIRVDVTELQRESLLSSILPSLLMMILMIINFSFLFNKMNGGGGKMANFGKSKAKMSVEGENKVTFDNVAGCDEEKAELEELVHFLKAPQKFTDLGARIPKGVLLPVQVKHCWQRRLLVRRECLSSAFPVLTSWKCSLVSAHPVSVTCSNRRKRTPPVSYSSMKSMPLVVAEAQVLAAVTMRENRH